MSTHPAPLILLPPFTLAFHLPSVTSSAHKESKFKTKQNETGVLSKTEDTVSA